MDGIRFRPATPRDTTVVAELVAAGFATYREFAPPGWQPRSAIQEEVELHTVLSRGDVHARLALAESDGRAAGFTAWRPATTLGDDPQPIAGRAHLRALFVARDWWGTGLAHDLLEWSVDGMRQSGFTTGQLWTPTDHARARAFYEREGWRATDERFFSPDLALDLTRFEIDLSA